MRRGAASFLPVARAISEPRPRTSTDWTDPSAPFMKRSPPSLRQAESPIHVAAQHVSGSRRHDLATGRGSGHITGTRPGARRASLERYTRPPASATSSSRSSRRAGSPLAVAGMSSANVQPGSGKPSSPELACSNRFSTARNDAQRAALSRSSVVRTTPRRRTAWRTGIAGSRGDRRCGSTEHAVKRVEELRQGLDVALPQARMPAKPELVERLDRPRVQQAARHESAHAPPRANSRGRSRAGSSSYVAWLPHNTERPRLRPRETVDHATEYR